MIKGLLATSVLIGLPFTAAIFLLGNPTAVKQDEDRATPANNSFVDVTTLPQGGGLPVQVRTGLYFVEVSKVDEGEEVFNATVDLRLRWKDTRLKFDPARAPAGFLEFRAREAAAKLDAIWHPPVELTNLQGEATQTEEALRIYPDGRAELLKREKGTFETSFDPQNFPFDRQKLTVEVAVRGESSDRVALDYRQDDLDFSGVASKAELAEWTFGLVDFQRSPVSGFYGESHSRLLAELSIQRKAGPGLGPIFIPLVASLLIPLMAIYMNKVVNGEFQIEAFELSNIVIGGLFAVIALNFTVNSDYPSLGAGDNTVSRLFALNYLVLGGALAIIVILFRFNLVQRAFGKYVQEQLYIYIVWAGPLLVWTTAAAILLIAAA